MHRGLETRRLVTAALVVILTGCAPSATITPATPGPTTAIETAAISPAAGPSAAASAPAPSVAPSYGPSFGALQVFPPGSAIEITVAELNIRRKPSTSAKRLEILRRGEVLIVSPADNLAFGWGPVKKNGYTWYPVVLANVAATDRKLDPLPKSPLVYGGEPLSGWIATDDGTEPYVVMVPPRCPTTVDLLNVSGMLPAERIACFGPEPFVLEGTFGCAGCGAISFGTFKPAWLATPVELDFLSLAPEEQFGPMALRFPPGGPPRPAAGAIIRVTIHVDDSRATQCQMTESDGAGTSTPIDKETAVYYCRERLVVDSYEVLGTDPNFPAG